MSKYTIVQHEKRLFWLQDCPVLLQSCALTKNNVDNNIFLQCKFENIADKSIKAMYIAVKCSDVAHNQVSGVDNFSYLDIAVQPYSLFGDKTPVELQDDTTRNVRIIPLKVIFSDDSTWENTSERAYELAEYEQQCISSLGELADQYKHDLHTICADSGKHNYLPTNANGFTICGCGKVVLNDAVSCPSCGVDLNLLRQLGDLNTSHITSETATTDNISNTDSDELLSPETAESQALVLAEEQHTTNPANPKKWLMLGSIVAVVAAIIACVSVFLLLPKPLNDVTTLSDGSRVTFQASYIMEVPCYSYGTYASKFDPDNKTYLCFAFDVENKGTEQLSIKDTFSGSIKERSTQLDIMPSYMSATKDDEELVIESGTNENALLILPVPKETDLSNVKIVLQIAGKKYKFDREFTDVRDFVREFQSNYSKVLDLLSDIGATRKKLLDDASGFNDTSNIFLKLLVMYTSLDNLYTNSKDFHSTANTLYSSLSALTAPDIPYYQETLSELTSHTKEISDKLQCFDNMKYPTNAQNSSSNIDCMDAFTKNFSTYCFTEILEVGSYYLVDFGTEN